MSLSLCESLPDQLANYPVVARGSRSHVLVGIIDSYGVGRCRLVEDAHRLSKASLFDRTTDNSPNDMQRFCLFTDATPSAHRPNLGRYLEMRRLFTFMSRNRRRSSPLSGSSPAIERKLSSDTGVDRLFCGRWVWFVASCWCSDLAMTEYSLIDCFEEMQNRRNFIHICNREWLAGNSFAFIPCSPKRDGTT